MFFLKNLNPVRILTAAFLAVSLLFTACEQLGGILRDEDAALKTLSVDRGTLSPAFSASHSEYRVTVRNDVDSITVTATANSGKASVNGAGTKTLDAGSTTIPVVISAESGASKTYTIIVKRLDASVIGIETAEEMAKIGVDDDWSLADEYALLNDIILEDWMPIGDKDDPFTGVFDGNDHKITLNGFSGTAVSGKTYLGIFGYVKGESSAKAAIKDMAIHSAVNATGTAQAVGLVTGYAELAEIENITLTGTFDYTSPSTNYVGGIVGLASGEGTLIKNSASALTMNIAPGTSATLVTGVINYSYVGGFVGIFNKGPGIENCHYTGNITADDTHSGKAAQIFVGGIAGGSSYLFNTAYNGYIKDSSFTGTVIGKARGSWTFAGGIAGTIVGDGNGTLENTTRIERCFAKGIVSVAGTSSGFPYIGGVVGYNYYGALVSQSYFDGNVIADRTNDYTGGIAGYNSQTSNHNSRIEDCWSDGTVTGFNNAGGIVGVNQTQTYIRRSYSRAALSITDTTDKVVGSWSGGVGGIAGFNASMLSDAITACVALNPSLNAAQGNYIQRVVGRPTTTSTGDGRSNNHAWSGMTVTTGGVYTPDKGVNATDGADCAQKPNQAFYENIGWDFVNVWKMGADGYPKLMWQK